jgi:hypothetical protein
MHDPFGFVHSVKRSFTFWASFASAATFLLFIAAAVPVHGRNQGEADGKYIFRNDSVNLTTFYIDISPYTYVSTVDGNVQGWTNLTGGFILNNKFYLSIFLTFSPAVTKVVFEGQEVYATFLQEGIKLGYMHRTDRMLFWRTNLAVGLGGGYTLAAANSVVGGLFDNWLYRASMYSIEPSVGLGFNMLPWWRLYVDLGYRFMGPSDENIGVSDDSATVNISLGFGKYHGKARAK